MDKKFLITALTLFLTLPAFAELTVDDLVSPDYLKNHGYSNSIIWSAQKSMATTNGEVLNEPIEKPIYNKPVIKQLRKFFMYIDPALDNHSFNNHNINTTTRYDDL